MSLDFEQIYQAYYMQVYSFVMTIMKNTHLAEEITQNTFLKAIKAQEKFKGISSEWTWLCAIAKNEAYDMLRKQSKETNAKPDFVEVKDSKESLEHRMETKESTFEIHKILHSLEEPYKEVFQLRIFGELSFTNIGEIFGKTENWARVTFHRARIKIQERMEENG